MAKWYMIMVDNKMKNRLLIITGFIASHTDTLFAVSFPVVVPG